LVCKENPGNSAWGVKNVVPTKKTTAAAVTGTESASQKNRTTRTADTSASILSVGVGD